MAVIGRLPVFIEGELWGLSAVIVYLNTLIGQSGINEFSNSYYFQLAKTNPNTGIEEFFLPVDETIEFDDVQSVDFPEGEWKCMAAYRNSAGYRYSFLFIGIFSLMVSILCGYLSYRLFRKPFELEDLIDEQSKKLLESREQFKQSSELLTSVLESPQNIAIFSLDRDYNYISFNENYRRMVQDSFGVPVKKGMNIFDVVPKKSRALLMVNFNRALNGEAFEFIQENVDTDMNVQYWQNWFSPIRDRQKILSVSRYFPSILHNVLRLNKPSSVTNVALERSFQTLRTAFTN